MSAQQKRTCISGRGRHTREPWAHRRQQNTARQWNNNIVEMMMISISCYVTHSATFWLTAAAFDLIADFICFVGRDARKRTTYNTDVMAHTSHTHTQFIHHQHHWKQQQQPTVWFGSGSTITWLAEANNNILFCCAVNMKREQNIVWICTRWKWILHSKQHKWYDNRYVQFCSALHCNDFKLSSRLHFIQWRPQRCQRTDWENSDGKKRAPACAVQRTQIRRSFRKRRRMMEASMVFFFFSSLSLWCIRYSFI